MRSRRRRLQRQRKNNGERFRPCMGIASMLPSVPVTCNTIRVWGRPRGCFDNAGKLRSYAK